MSILIVLRTLNEAALDADLTKNEAKVFQHLINKTLTYCKVTADQTDSSIGYCTNIRADRVKIAAESLIEKGLFTRTPVKITSKRRGLVDGYRYQVAPAFLTDVDADFFGSSIPKSSPRSSPKNGDIQTVNNTDINQYNNTHGKFFDEHNQMDMELCSRELVKPQNVDLSTYENLLPALTKLKSPQAQNVLDVLSCAITDNSIKTTPVRLGFGLIKQAHAGLLDISCLQKTQTQAPRQKQRISEDELELASQNAMYKQMAKLQGISVDEVKQQLGVR